MKIPLCIHVSLTKHAVHLHVLEVGEQALYFVLVSPCGH